MKAVVIYEAGGVDKLIYQDVETPKVKPGWSLVKVKGFGINRSEIFTRQGYSESVHFPRILCRHRRGQYGTGKDSRRNESRVYYG